MTGKILPWGSVIKIPTWKVYIEICKLFRPDLDFVKALDQYPLKDKLNSHLGFNVSANKIVNLEIAKLDGLKIFDFEDFIDDPERKDIKDLEDKECVLCPTLDILSQIRRLNGHDTWENEWENQWNQYKENTCYIPFSDSYSSYRYLAKNEYKFYPYSNFISAEDSEKQTPVKKKNIKELRYTNEGILAPTLEIMLALVKLNTGGNFTKIKDKSVDEWTYSWNRYKEKTCYIPASEQYCDLGYAKNHNYTIYKSEEFLDEEVKPVVKRNIKDCVGNKQVIKAPTLDTLLALVELNGKINNSNQRERWISIWDRFKEETCYIPSEDWYCNIKTAEVGKYAIYNPEEFLEEFSGYKETETMKKVRNIKDLKSDAEVILAPTLDILLKLTRLNGAGLVQSEWEYSWQRYKENTCYIPAKGCYCELGFAQTYNYKIYDNEEFLEEEVPTSEMEEPEIDIKKMGTEEGILAPTVSKLFELMKANDHECTLEECTSRWNIDKDGTVYIPKTQLTNSYGHLQRLGYYIHHDYREFLPSKKSVNTQDNEWKPVFEEVVINKNNNFKYIFLFQKNDLFYCAQNQNKITEKNFSVYGFPLNVLEPVSNRVIRQITLKDAEKLLSTEQEQVQIIAFNL